MTSSVGGIIEAVDYNSIRNKVISVLGTGSSNFGYGQDSKIQSSSVSVGNTITALHWQNLRYDIYNCLVHINGSTPSVTTVATGEAVRYGSGYPNNAYDLLANNIISNRFALGTGQYVTESQGSIQKTDSWYSQVECEITCTFPTADEARYFFNSGGQIRISSSRTGGSSVSQNTAWSNVLTGAGTQAFGGNNPTTDITAVDGGNWYRCGNSYSSPYYTGTSSAPYSANLYRLYAKSNVSNNSTGSANILYIRVLFTDAYFDPGPEPSPPPGDLVDGTLTVSVETYRASGVMQPAPATGNFTIVGPSVSISSITGT